MQFTTILLSAIFAIPAVLGESTIAYFSDFYDENGGSNSLWNVACADNAYGLVTTKGFNQVKNGSPLCGSCWGINYQDTTIYVTAIDENSDAGFVLSQTAMAKLTHGEGIDKGSVEVNYWAADPSFCSNKNWDN